MRPADLEFEDPPAQRGESAFGLQLPLRGQIARFAQRQMHALVEVFAELAITPKHVIGDVFSDERPGLLGESLVLRGKRDTGKVH